MAEKSRRANIIKEQKEEKIKKNRVKAREHREPKELSKKDIVFKNTLIIVLLLVCLIETVYIVFFTMNLKENSVKKSFLSTSMELQKKVSMYLSNKSFELYEAYNYAQILTGTVINENEEKQTITDLNNEALVSLVSEELKMEMGDVEYYAANSENIKEVLKVELPSYLRSVTWYIGSDGSVKVKCDSKPKWWTSELDVLLVGN